MKGKHIGQEWYKGDRTSGNKLYITVDIEKTEKTKEIQAIYQIITASKGGFLEYMYYVLSDTWKIVAKFKGGYTPEYKAKLRKALFDYNKSELNTVESITLSIKDKVQSLFHDGTVSLIRGSAFSKELQDIPEVSETLEALNVCATKPVTYDTLGREFSKFMNECQLMLAQDPSIFLDINHKQVDIEVVIKLLLEKGFIQTWGLDNVTTLFKMIFHPGVLGTIAKFRFWIPVYRPRRKYIEFADCIYDILEPKHLSKQTKLVDFEDIIIHPWCTLDKPYMYYKNNIPCDDFIQILNRSEPNTFESMLNDYLSKNSIVLDPNDFTDNPIEGRQ